MRFDTVRVGGGHVCAPHTKTAGVLRTVLLSDDSSVGYTDCCWGGVFCSWGLCSPHWVTKYERLRFILAVRLCCCGRGAPLPFQTLKWGRGGGCKDVAGLLALRCVAMCAIESR